MKDAPPAGAAPPRMRVLGFRRRLVAVIMLMVGTVTALTLYVSEWNLAANIERELQRDFEAELTALHQGQAIRHAALVERCRALVRRPRIHAAFEDNALDLLYPSAEDELRDVMSSDAEPSGVHASTLRAQFYRFLDRNGHVISPPAGAAIGELSAEEAAQLALPRLTDTPQVGYLPIRSPRGTVVTEVIAMPIISSESGEAIAALVLGFRPLGTVGERPMHSGVSVHGELHLPNCPPAIAPQVRTEMSAVGGQDEGSRRLRSGDSSYLLFFKRLNADSLYATAYEVSLYSLDQFASRETKLRFRVIALGALLLAISFGVAHLLSGRLSAPVEKMAVETERSARFSADASHQLKTPVTVLRAGLEELLTRDNLTPEECDAIGALIHQTYRLSSLIEDLLLLARMDSGRLSLAHDPVDLGHLIAAALDDLGAMPDTLALQIETDVPETLHVSGERRYTAMILQNLLENARKYNREHGRIRILARVEGESVLLSVGNTGKPMSAAAQRHIFERFHRGNIGENVPGYGLGLNLARELARLHGGDLRLVRSADDWTEFEVRFRLVQPALVSQ